LEMVLSLDACAAASAGDWDRAFSSLLILTRFREASYARSNPSWHGASYRGCRQALQYVLGSPIQFTALQWETLQKAWEGVSVQETYEREFGVWKLAVLEQIDYVKRADFTQISQLLDRAASRRTKHHLMNSIVHPLGDGRRHPLLTVLVPSGGWDADKAKVLALPFAKWKVDCLDDTLLVKQVNPLPAGMVYGLNDFASMKVHAARAHALGSAALTLKRHQAKHGRLPDSLAEIGLDHDQLRYDPQSGELWSVGMKPDGRWRLAP
ncbi:MAG: hypothetical protein ACKVHP_08770, partial [Verrucomicrobiales bacterium]